MAAFLKIENIGVAPEEGFTVFGVSLADTSLSNGVIGQFGSGNKHGVAVLLRNELSPVVFAGNLKLEFSTRSQTVSDTQATKEFSRVVVKYGGFSLEPGIEFRDVGVMSQCIEHTDAPLLGITGDYFGQAFVLRIHLEPVAGADTREIVDTLRNEVRPIEEQS